MRILQVITELRPAGAERVLAALVPGLVRAGCQVETLSLMPLPDSSSVLDALTRAGVEVHSLGVTRNAPWHALGFRRAVQRFSPHVVHAHLVHPHLLSRCLTGRHRPGIINTIHNADRRPGRGWQFTLDRFTAGRCHLMTAVSKAVRDFHAPRIGLDPEAMRVIYNGIDAPAAPDDAEVTVLRRAWGVDDCTVVLGSVGRLIYQKGYDLLLRDLQALARRIPTREQWGLVLIGEGDQRNELEALAERAPHNLRVRLPGFRDDAARAMGAFDVFLMPSRFEGFGLTLAEAMTHGLPIVASGVDAIPELLEGYTGGFIVPDTGVTGFSDLIPVAVEAGRNPGRNPFPVDAMVADYLQAYRDVAADR